MLIIPQEGRVYTKKGKFMKNNHRLYYAYSDHLKERYGEKVYKLPVNLPVSCPNRTGGKRGCSFCAGCGTGFEAMGAFVPVREQLEQTKQYIGPRYHAHKFIAYFQNYTNTFLPLLDFRRYAKEAAEVPDLVGISVSTRPDCVRRDYLDVLKDISAEYGLDITIELGLQTVNYRTLERTGRGHGLAEFIDAVLAVREYGFDTCAHVILNLPGDDRTDCTETARVLSSLRVACVKIHSLYIAKNTRLCEEFENGTIAVCPKEEYFRRLIVFLENLSPHIAVERLFSRVPEKDAVFCNWGRSWWALKDELIRQMKLEGSYQGRCFHYLGGAALDQLQGA